MSRSGSYAVIALVAVLAVLAVSEVASFELTPCRGVKTPYKKISVSACPDNKGDRCNFSPNKEFTIEIEFDTPKPFKTARTHMHLLRYQEHAFGCDKGLKCPSVAGDKQKMVWKTHFPVKPMQPWVADFEVGVLDATTEEYLICYKMPAQLSGSISSTAEEESELIKLESVAN